ncbi:MAG: flagellar M-ring protein FliF [Planctomycetes bacterium]|nr:flagellar M-ring protein FliF [Planctomycetota bacterium]
MNSNFKQVFDQLSSVWKRMDFPQKVFLLLMACGFLGGILFWANWARKPSYGLLYGHLSSKEAGEIVSKLKDLKIPYELKDGGTAVLVSSEKIYEARLALANEGLPRGDIGFELFDKVNFGMSDFVQRVNYRRALQGELAKTISHIDDVEWAQVQIVMPEQSIFTEGEKPATASVILKLRASTGGSLKPIQIAGITHLVCSSIEGLKPDNVTITDNHGNLLSKKTGSSLDSVANDQLDLKRRIEDYYASKAESMLEKIMGIGKAVVKVSADLDFRHIDEKQVEYDPEKRVPKIQTVTSRLSGSNSPVPGGPAGMQANLVQSGITQPGGGTSEEEETAQTQFELSKTERVVAEHSASLKKLTVAVLVDGTYQTEKGEDGSTKRTYVPRSQEDLNQMAAIVKQAIGLNEAAPRNDTFEIKNVQFYEPSFEEEEATVVKEQQKDFIIKIAKNGSLGIAALGFLMFAMMALRRIKHRAKNVVQNMAVPVTAEGTRQLIGDGGQRGQVVDDIRKDPALAANVLKKWLVTGGGKTS